VGVSERDAGHHARFEALAGGLRREADVLKRALPPRKAPPVGGAAGQVGVHVAASAQALKLTFAPPVELRAHGSAAEELDAAQQHLGQRLVAVAPDLADLARAQPGFDRPRRLAVAEGEHFLGLHPGAPGLRGLLVEGRDVLAAVSLRWAVL